MFTFSTLRLYGDNTVTDVSSVKFTLNKNGFYYEGIIAITLKNKLPLVKQDNQLININNYSVYPESDKDNPKACIHPYKVKRGEKIAKIFLYVELQPGTTYILDVTPNTISYEDGSLVNFGTGTFSGISIDNKYVQYMQYQTTSKLDMNANLSIDGDITQNLINSEQNLLHLDINGRIYLDNTVPDYPLNNILTSLEWKHGFNNIEFMFLDGHVNYESTQDFATKNIVAGLEIESLIPVPKWLTFSKTQYSPFPSITLGYDFARSINFNDNMNRLSGNFKWTIPIGDKITFENLFSGVIDLDNSSQQYGYRQETIYYKIGDDTKLMIVQIAEGQLPPLFAYARSITTGRSINFVDLVSQNK
jgi:hypothetical protein